jgi:bifunctional non-homologous end joining protein LigD
MPRTDPLGTYRKKRNFAVTPEPEAGGAPAAGERVFVVQKHWATRLHYDFRLELDGTMKSWAVPKGPSLDPADKRMAVHVEDHPIAYNEFEGRIPEGEYGAGDVIVWDRGTWVPLVDARDGYRDGHLKFELRGQKLHGRWALVRMKGKGEGKEAWLLIKEKDAHARAADEYSVVDALPDSVVGGAARKRKATAKQAEKPESQASAAKPAKPGAAPARKTRGRALAVLGTAIDELPKRLAPQLATLAEKPPGDPDDWVYEVKFDGYRMLARIDGGDVRLVTRNGNDWSDRLPHLVRALKKMAFASGWLDGEIVVLDERGIPDFQALQNAFDRARVEDVIYYVFDLPYYAGHDLTEVPLVERRRLLESLMDKSASHEVRHSDTIVAASRDILDSACRMGLEGVIAKRLESRYAQRRTSDWIKLKCTRRQEFVVAGYTDPQGTRSGLGSLLLGFYDDAGRLVYAGNVGTGFDETALADLKKKLGAIQRAQSPYAVKTPLDAKAHWVAPKLVAEVSFAAWTESGRIRHAVFHGLRLDKDARSVTREAPAPLPPAPEIPGKLKVSHPERVVDPSTGVTKLAVVEYYARVAALMMDHLKGRPVSLVRAPDGIHGQQFFQKHVESAPMLGLKTLDPALDPEQLPLLEVARPEGLMMAAQMNVIEFHTWNAHKQNIARPDRMTFDLDPGHGVAWRTMQESAHLVRAFLDQLGLTSFIKTSGGKGLHIVVPLKRLYDWDTVKDFSRAIVQHLAATLPQRFSAKSGEKNRVGRIFIDYLRNGFGATTVAAWSARARPGLGVSVPIAWNELDALESAAHWTVTNAASRLAIGNSPWDAYAKSSHGLGAAMAALGFTPSRA